MSRSAAIRWTWIARQRAAETCCQWQALQATGICSPSSAYRQFRERSDVGGFAALWRQGLLAYDGLAGIDWEWLAVD